MADMKPLADLVHSVGVILPDGTRARANRCRDLPYDRLFECREVDPPRFYWLEQEKGDVWPRVIETFAIDKPLLIEAIASLRAFVHG